MSVPPVIVLDDVPRERCLAFGHASRVIQARAAREVAPALAAMQAALAEGHFLAGYFSYELGYALEPRLAQHMPAQRHVPLLWFGVFDAAPQDVPAATLMQAWAATRAYAAPIAYEWDRQDYARRFDQALAAIAAGDIYQVNLSLRGRFKLSGDPRALYRALRASAGAAYGAYIDDGERQILSFSPELFFRIDADGGICTRPMKGTARRDGDAAGDAALRAALAGNPKDRAENLMIVDLLRNDLGRIAQIGSVNVSELFAVETYPTVHQMTSTVSARLAAPHRVEDVLRALFPSGSITGTPKISAMQRIAELEQSPRGVYCGAVGMFAPDGSAQFNVAIRTLTLAAGCGEIGIGSAVVSDSRADAEYAECLLKAQYFERARCELGLIETLRFSGGSFVRLERHLARMRASADALGLPFAADAALAALDAAVAGHGATAVDLRIRLHLSEAGRFAATCAAIDMATPSWRYIIADARLCSADALLKHKIDWRDTYDGEYARAIQAGADEAIFLNERDEVCEGSRSTVFVERNGELTTPSLACGCLPGCLREEWLALARCREAVITLADLAAADRVYLGNSLRGLIPALPLGASAAMR